ncbi:MAG: hypothetical protein WC645_02990 [Candidatus Margulisiibacteriota bacterium]
MGIHLERARARFLDIRVRVYESLRCNAHWMGFANDNLAALPALTANLAMPKFPVIIGTCWEPKVREFIRGKVREALLSSYDGLIDRGDLFTKAIRVAQRAATLLTREVTGGTLKRVLDSEIDLTLERFRAEAVFATQRRMQIETTQRAAEERVRRVQEAIQEQRIVSEQSSRAEEMIRSAEAQRRAVEELRSASAELRKAQDELTAAVAEESARNNAAASEAEARAVGIRKSIERSTAVTLDQTQKRIVSQAESATQRRLDQAEKDAAQEVEKQLPIDEFVNQATEELTGLINRFVLKVAGIVQGDNSFQTAVIDTHELGEALVEILLKELQDKKGKIDPGGMALVLVEQLISRGLFVQEDRSAVRQLWDESRIINAMDAWWQKYNETIQTLSSPEDVQSSEAIRSAKDKKAKEHENS